jgi:hypothetical protein
MDSARNQWSTERWRCTFALAYSIKPPKGANIRPNMKNIGNTVFGVSIGLIAIGSLASCSCGECGDRDEGDGKTMMMMMIMGACETGIEG